jgi:hypothetical protein
MQTWFTPSLSPLGPRVAHIAAAIDGGDELGA